MKNLYKHVKDFLIALFLCVFLFLLGEQIYYRFGPINWFVEYESVTLVGNAVEDQPLKFISVFFAAKGVELNWNDNLYCDENGNGEFNLFSSQPFERTFDKEKPMNLSSKTWIYDSQKPKAGSFCFLSYGPKIILPYGITRIYPQKISNVFEIQSRKFDNE